ncbi:DNA-directed RNA polymerase I subunit rpa49 [Borealophlyctis nickersoniae]|nr:DNA-directed RNA polymerase I subunit rpa49 [Borealophlyctis nickersoniae]
MSSSSAKKRKPTAPDSLLHPAQILTPDVDGPLLASFPDPPSKPYALGVHTYTSSSGSTSGKRRRIVVGETEKLEYVGDNAEGGGLCRYVVGIVDKTAGTLTLAPSEFFRMSTTIKTLKHHESKQIGEKNLTARNILGEAFGTKKRKQMIKALERNQVDVGGLQDAVQDITAEIDEKIAAKADGEEGAKVAPTWDQRDWEDRGIPKYNVSAQTPMEVYNIDDIISPAEFKAINISHIQKIKFKEELKTALADVDPPSWLWEQFHTALQSKHETKRIKTLMYLGWLFKLFRLKDKDVGSPKGLAFHLGAPELVAENMRGRFTEFKEDRGVMKYRLPARLRDKVLSYALVLCLLVNDCRFDVTHIASDLSIPATRVTKIAKELACKVEAVPKTEGGTQGMKRAKLVVPVVFPEKRRH